MEKEIQELEEGPKEKMHLDALGATKKFTELENTKSYMHSGLQNLLLPLTDCLLNWLNAQKKQIHPDRKRLQKGTTPNNYKLITCLPMMWKIITHRLGR